MSTENLSADIKNNTDNGSTRPPSNSEMENQHQLVSKVSVKIPPFWKKNVEIWFLQVESQFSISSIKSEVTKFHYIVASLDSEIAESISDLLCKPLSQQPYKDLKSRLITQFANSDQTKLKLLQELELGDSKPSAFLQRMRTLSGDNISDTYLKTMFIQRMPTQYRPMLAANYGLSIDDLAKIADQTLEFSTTPHTIHAVDNNCHTSGSSQEQNSILQRLERIEELMSKSEQPAEFSYDVNRVNDSSLCWYHMQFGKRARRCVAPCKYARHFKPSKNDVADQ